MARLKSARSRMRPEISRRTRIAQTCFGMSGRFWPMIRPLFQAGRRARMAGRFAAGMTVPPFRRSHLISDRVSAFHHTMPQRCRSASSPSRPSRERAVRGPLRTEMARRGHLSSSCFGKGKADPVPVAESIAKLDHHLGHRFQVAGIREAASSCSLKPHVLHNPHHRIHGGRIVAGDENRKGAGLALGMICQNIRMRPV